jgi:hypothetical protein
MAILKPKDSGLQIQMAILKPKDSDLQILTGSRLVILIDFRSQIQMPKDSGL